MLLSELLLGVSSELRAPLGGILEMARVLLDTALDRDQRRVVEALNQSSHLVITLVDDLVDMAKIESGKLETVDLDFDLRLAFDAVGTNLAADAASLGVAFQHRLPHSVPARFTGDPGRLRQVLQQVGQACLQSASVQDGLLALMGGLEKETPLESDVIFTFRFVPAAGAVAEAPAWIDGLVVGKTPAPATGGGLGLGLAVAHHLIGLLGGEATRVDAPGGMWGVSIRIPFAKQAVSDTARPEPPVDPGGRTILALMDEGVFWESVQRSIRGTGTVVERAPNAAAAVQALRTAARSGRGYTAVLVHLEMPGLDAARFARLLRRNEEPDATPLILATSLGRSGDLVLAVEWGYSAYLSGPVTAELMRETLEAALRRCAGPEDLGGLVTLVTRHSIAEDSKGRRCVVIVDDDALDQLHVISALKKMGYAAEVLADRDEILRRIEAKAAHLVVIPVSPVRPNPAELVSRIRASGEPGRRVPILAVVSPDQGAAWSPGSLPVDATVSSDSPLGILCDSIESLLLHGAPPRIGPEDDVREAA